MRSLEEIYVKNSNGLKVLRKKILEKFTFDGLLTKYPKKIIKIMSTLYSQRFFERILFKSTSDDHYIPKNLQWRSDDSLQKKKKNH